MKIIKFKLIAFIMLTGIVFTACNQSGKQMKESSEVKTEQSHNINYQVGDHVPNDLVCMVNNAFMGEHQMPVPVEGKTYYGCCEMCVGRLNEDVTSRMAKDPYSGNDVDKSDAYIVISDEHGKVEYYESRENFVSHNQI